jgi:hypothetical protein
MRYVLIALFLTVLSLAPERAPAAPPDTSSSQAIPVDQANAQKAKDVLDQAIKALGGDAYLHWTDVTQEGRGYSFHHGEANSVGTPFWRLRKFPDEERDELTKKRDVIEIYNGDQGYEITYKGVRNLDHKDELDPYLRRHHYSLDVVLRQWLNQPGVALFYEGQTLAAQKETDQVTIMNAKNEAVTLNFDINSHLPVKKSFKWRDPTDQQRNVEDEIFDDYRPVQGIMTPFNITRMFNGEMAAQSFCTQAKYNQNLSDSLFDAQANSSRKH